MRAYVVWVVVTLLESSLAVGQFVPASRTGTQTGPPPATQAAAFCLKTITFAVAEGGQPVPAVPKFTAKWVGKAKHVEGYSDMCLSQIPSSRTANYVVVFSMSESSFDGLTPIAHTYTSTAPLSNDSPGSGSYGGTWTYSYKGALPPETTGTIALQRIDGAKKGLLLRAFNEQGRMVSQYGVDGSHSREDRLEQVLSDIHRDAVEKPNQRHISAPFSVYYVNCDIDSPGPSSMVAAATPTPTEPEVKPPAAPQHPLPPPQATLDLVSTPSGADIYVDDKFIGKTPFTFTVPPGEHIVIMRKTDFGTWSRKLELASGPRRVSAYLEQKFLTFPSSPPQTATQPQGSQQQASQQRSARPQVMQQQAHEPAQYWATQPQNPQRQAIAAPTMQQQAAQSGSLPSGVAKRQ